MSLVCKGISFVDGGVFPFIPNDFAHVVGSTIFATFDISLV
jgi:hypothetical protein